MTAGNLTPAPDILRTIKGDLGISLGDLTVLSASNDPLRLNTAVNHRNGSWLRDQMERADLLGRTIHNRGLHYTIVSFGDAKLPSGLPYKNDADCWAFLEAASKAARWLAYVPWDGIVDARNEAPIIRTYSTDQPRAQFYVAAEIQIPDVDDMRPSVRAADFVGRQHYRLVFWGEKTSLAAVLDPLAQTFGADLYLPSGEISDSQLHAMAKTGAEDGREMVVLVFADADPSGYQMAVSIGHKLRCFRETFYPSLEFRVIAPALTVEQVRELGLPSTPLKPTELRADGWRARYGIEQTEIDALATLQPGVLQHIVREAVRPYYDSTLAARVREARDDWEAEAQAQLDLVSLDEETIAAMRARAEAALAPLREEMRDIEIAADGIELPAMQVPEPRLSEPPAPLVSSGMQLLDHIQSLRARKDYGGAS